MNKFESFKRVKEESEAVLARVDLVRAETTTQFGSIKVGPRSDLLGVYLHMVVPESNEIGNRTIDLIERVDAINIIVALSEIYGIEWDEIESAKNLYSRGSEL